MKERMIFSVIFVFGVFFTAISSADAATYYVATTGNDTNAGTQSSPFRTLNKGISMLGPGVTVYIRGGTYIENINGSIFPAGSSWTNLSKLAGYPGEIVINKPAQGRDGALMLEFCGSGRNYIEIADIVFDSDWPNIQPPTNGTPAIKLCGGAHHIRLKNIESKNSGGTAILTGGNGADESNFFELIDLKIHDLGFNSAYCCGANGIYMTGSDNLIDGGIFYNNYDGCGVRIWDSDVTKFSNRNIVRNTTVYSNGGRHGCGINISDYDNTAYNNVVYGITGSAIVLGAGKTAYRTKLYNNTVYNNLAGGGLASGIDIRADAYDTVVKNNILLDNESPSYSGATQIGNLGQNTSFSNNLCGVSGTGCATVANPKFVNASANDFHLQSTSPAINYGVVLPEFTTDKDGKTRVGNYDAGAYEYGGTAPSTLQGDLNNDRIVNSLDWSLMSAKWLTNDTNADLNKDGIINSLDWSVMSSNWLKTI